MNVNFHNSKIDVWVMREYNRGDSWCKLFTLEESRELRSFKCVRPLGYSSDGNKVLLKHNWKRLCWYDLRKKEEVADFRMRTSQVESNDGSATVAAPGESVTESLKTNCGHRMVACPCR
ncbi:F-box protein CPR1 [Glycine soja]|uniref:F-box protein CPR1 n=1 Tax=Glycine soja TaxID=3848 RepID=A0A445M0B7_GLYSO|nr:F-box protein CPR1 [Glycine soja]